jgi:hypothetical protein
VPSFVTYDSSGATETSFNGINRHNMITGRYTDSNGIRHGFLAQANTHYGLRTRQIRQNRPGVGKPDLSGPSRATARVLVHHSLNSPLRS